ncbi:hypothetical protein KKC13_10420 [bacterium]|nr:hypothetical protein [bacterium]MBU1956856.1 hypothetical protein [bacterium]
MRNQQQYVTISHYKEREFYFLNHAIQTHDGFIPKEMEQFHESEKEKFIERIRLLQSQYPLSQTVSISLASTQTVTDKEDENRASAKIFENNYVVQESIDIGNIPTSLYFSPFAILYEEYKNKLDNKLTLLIGLFDRKLYIMFATADKIHESWTIGTRGLTEKQVADRVYKSMKAYYKISYKFADHIEMLVTDDSPKLLKVLREELSLKILPAQNTIHNLLHHMGGSQKRAKSSYIKSSLPQTEEPAIKSSLKVDTPSTVQSVAQESLDDIRLNNSTSTDQSSRSESVSAINRGSIINMFISFIPLLVMLGVGAYFTLQNDKVLNDVELKESQSFAQTSNALLATTSNDVFSSMGKSAELKNAIISNSHVELKGVVWGIEPLRNSLNELYNDGEFIIKPLENFMTEFSFKSKV